MKFATIACFSLLVVAPFIQADDFSSRLEAIMGLLRNYDLRSAQTPLNVRVVVPRTYIETESVDGHGKGDAISSEVIRRKLQEVEESLRAAAAAATATGAPTPAPGGRKRRNANVDEAVQALRTAASFLDDYDVSIAY